MDKPDKFYYNLSCPNLGQTLKLASTDTTNQTILLENPSEYEVSCVRFDVFTFFPLFFPIIPDPAHPLRTDLSITLSYQGSYFQVFVEVEADEVKNGITSIGPFLTELNVASRQALTNLKTVFPAAPMNMAPYFALNPDTQIVSMYVDVTWIEPTANANLIYFNQSLQSIINLPFRNNGAIPVPFGADYQIRVLDYAKIIPVINTRFGYPNYLFSFNFAIVQVEQEYAQTNNFLGLDRLILSSSQIPAVPELVPLSFPGQSNTTQNNTFPVLTDLAISALDHNNLYSLYLPTAEFRRISMISNGALKVVDLSLYYTTTDGQIRPVVLRPGDYFTAKILFERIR